jgi:cytochrome c-type biogenesis protein CcmH
MILLWIVLGAMTLAAAVILAWPLFDSRRFKNDSSFALAVYRDQLAEINHDAARGILDEAQARAAQIEIERRILSLDDAPKFRPARAPTPLLIVAMAVVLPLAGFGLYLRLGSPGLPGEPAGARTVIGEPASPALLALGQAVANSPTDPAAWRALGEGLMASHRAAEAANAFGRAVALGDPDPKLQSRYGSALVLAEGNVGEKARAAFAAALAADPTDAVARFFLALAKEQAGDPAAALTEWLALERELPPDIPWRADLAANIDRVARKLGKDPAALPGRTPASAAATASSGATGSGATEPGPGSVGVPSQSDLEAAAQMSAGDRQAFIETMVAKLAAHLKAQPTDLEGWSRLARAYGVLGRHEESRATWAKAAQLAPSRLDVQLDYANALIDGTADLSHDLPSDFAATVTRIRTIAPDNPLGLYYGGLVARANGDKQTARDLWTKVLVLIPAGTPQHASLQREIDSLGQ